MRIFFLCVALLVPTFVSANDATESLKRSITAKVDSHLLLFAEEGADLTISANGHTIFTRFPNLPAATVRKLAAFGADPNGRDGKDNSALSYAIRAAQDSNTVAALLDAGADINRADGSGLTPLQVALLHDQYSCVELLLQRGASLDFVPSAAILAKRHGTSQTIELLTRQGVRLPPLLSL